jgi:hypothetical protein
VTSRATRLFKSLAKYALIVLLFVGLARWDETRMEPFNRTEWTAGDARQQRRMARWMISEKVLSGLNSAAVLRMLGEPHMQDQNVLKFELGRPLLEGDYFFIMKLQKNKVIDYSLSVVSD